MTHAISKRHRFFVPLIILATSPLVQAATDCATVSQIPQVECEALVALYNSAGGPNWSDNSSNNWNVTNMYSPKLTTDFIGGYSHSTLSG